MAKFRVGQRVRIRQEAGPLSRRAGYDIHAGREAVITHLDVDFDPIYGAFHGLSIRHINGMFIQVSEAFLEPITDPKAEAFLESIRQLKPLPVQEIA